MRKSTLIATCLVNSRLIPNIEDAESSVKADFTDNFPHLNFNLWNEEVSDDFAQNIIKIVGKASKINVKKFIEDLS